MSDMRVRTRDESRFVVGSIRRRGTQQSSSGGAGDEGMRCHWAPGQAACRRESSDSVLSMASALDVVKICIDWATGKNIVKADPLVGNWVCFDAEEMKKKFENDLLYKGVGANLFFFNLKAWAMDNQEVSLCEAKKYAEKHFNTKAAEEYYSFLDAKPGFPEAIAPSGKEPTFQWQCSIGAAATGPTVATATLGPPGTWRKISSDGQVYGFLYALATLIRRTPWSNAQSKVLDMLAATAMHCPIDVYPFVVSNQMQREIFLQSFQLMENLSVLQEDLGSSAWKICCLFNHARKMMDQTKDVNDALVDFFRGIQFAASSEYNLAALKKNRQGLPGVL